MYAEVAWVLVSSRTQVQPQVILDPDYLPDYLSVSHDYVIFQQVDVYLNDPIKIDKLIKSAIQ